MRWTHSSVASRLEPGGHDEALLFPLACSLATRVALYEAGAAATFVEVDPKTKTTDDGKNYLDIASLGLVPVLEIAPGDLLTENGAILQYVAARFPEARLAPEGVRERARLSQWLSFIGTELHEALFVPLLDKKAPKEVSAYALAKAASRLGFLEAHHPARRPLRSQAVTNVQDLRERTDSSYTYLDPQLRDAVRFAGEPAAHLRRRSWLHAGHAYLCHSASCSRAVGLCPAAVQRRSTK